MAYVRKRTSRSGSVSTALVESYRDDQGRPRQRILANLHGEPNTLRALAKLAAQRELLRKERDSLAAQVPDANRFYETVTSNALHGRQYSNAERREIDTLMRQRAQLLKRLTTVEAALALIQKDGPVIQKHCSATAEKKQAAIRAYKKRLENAQALALGAEFGKHEAKKYRAKLRRLSVAFNAKDFFILPENFKRGQ